jgi:hypothetical protein
MRSIYLPIQDQAACLFVSNFILVPRQDGSRGFLDFVIPLTKEAGPRSPLAYAFGACAYAALGNRPNVNVSKITLQAVAQYHQALQALQAALQDDVSSKSDATLCAVLLLALYEVCSRSWPPPATRVYVELAGCLVHRRYADQCVTAHH